MTSFIRIFVVCSVFNLSFSIGAHSSLTPLLGSEEQRPQNSVRQKILVIFASATTLLSSAGSYFVQNQWVKACLLSTSASFLFAAASLVAPLTP